MQPNAEETAGAKPQRSPHNPWPRYAEAVLGFRNYWYPALRSHKLRSKPVSLKILGERLMFLRHGERCYALEDRCAHRGLPLSLGSCQFPGTKTISCRYHGWTYDITNGQCVAAITDGADSPLIGKVRVASYPVEERKGIVWVFMGDEKPYPLEEDVPEEFLEEENVIGARVTLRKGNWRLAAENGLDPAHAGYLHRDAWLTILRRLPVARGKVTPEISGHWVGYTQSGMLLECDYPGLGHWPHGEWWKRQRKAERRGRPVKIQLRLPGYLRVDPFPARGIIHYEWYVPVDESHHRYFQFAVRWVSGLTALRFRVAYALWWKWLAHANFNGQDARMVELMEPFYTEEDGWNRERLFRPDVGLTAWRKHCHENARAVQKLKASANNHPSEEELTHVGIGTG